MVKIRKDVAFFDVVVIKTVDGAPPSEKFVKADFWSKVLTRIERLEAPALRTVRVGQVQYFGVVSRPTSPAVPHLQVGRIRDLSDHLEETDLETGAVEPLQLAPAKRVSEPTFIVPFTSGGRVAIFSPGRSTRHETIANWLTGVLKLAPKGKSIRFRPVVDEDSLAKLLASKGAVGVEFSVDASQELPTDSSILEAVENVREAGPSTGTLYFGWSLGRSGGSGRDQSMIKDLAEKLRTSQLAKRATVNMVVEDEDGRLKRETHSLVEDSIVHKVSYEASSDTRANTSQVLREIVKAIEDFRNRTNVGGSA